MTMTTRTATPDLVKDVCERWSGAFAADPEMPFDRLRATVEEWPLVTAEQIDARPPEHMPVARRDWTPAPGHCGHASAPWDGACHANRIEVVRSRSNYGNAR